MKGDKAMSFIDNLKEKTQESQHDKNKRKFSAVDAPKFLKKEDGSWNKTSIALSGLTLALVLGLGAYSIVNFQTKGSLIDDVIYGLSTEDAQKAVTEAFLTSINQYLDGEITEDQLREALANLVHDYITKSSAFTDEQKTELDEIINNYLQTVGIEDLIKSSETIEHINKEIETRFKENEKVIETLRESLEKEIQTNKEYTQEQLDILNNLHETLVKTEASHYSELQTKIQDTYNELYKLQQDQLYKDVAAWDKTKIYDIDSYVIYNDKLYRNVTGTSTDVPPSQDRATEQNPTGNWEQVSVMKTVQDNFNTFITNLYSGMTEWDEDGSYAPNSYVFYHNKIYRNINGLNTSTAPDEDTANWQEASIMTVINNTYNTFVTTVGAEDYDPNASYKAGDYVIYNNITYKNVSDNPSVAGDSLTTIPGVTEGDGTKNIWQPVTITDMIDNNYQTFIQTVGATDWNETASYQAGDYVIYNGHLYRNETGINSTPSESSENWSVVSITDTMESLTDRVQGLELKTATDLDDLKKGLLDLIDGNQSLDAEQIAALRKMIEDANDASADGLKNLYDQLMAAINAGDQTLAEQNAADREKLLNQLEVLNNNTASVMDSLTKRVEKLEDRTTAPDSTEFDFGNQDDSYGYYLPDGTFKPF